MQESRRGGGDGTYRRRAELLDVFRIEALPMDLFRPMYVVNEADSIIGPATSTSIISL